MKVFTGVDAVLISALAVIVICVCSAVSPAGVEGDVELLRMVAKGITVNREKLSTWQGKAQYTSVRSGTAYEDVFDEKYLEKFVDFAYSREINAIRWRSQVLEEAFERGGRREPIPGNRVVNGMVKEGAVYRLGPIPAGAQRPYTCSIQNTEGLKPKPYDFNPAAYFTVYDRNLPAMLEAYAGWVQDPKVNASVERVGDLVILTVKQELEERYTFDLSSGCNLVAFDYSDGEATKKSWTLAYEEHNGIYVPKNVVYETNRLYEDGAVQADRIEVEFETDDVNNQLDPCEFTLASIGMVAGDRIQDHRTGTQYIYEPEDEGRLSLELPAVEDLILIETEDADLADAEKTASVESPAVDSIASRPVQPTDVSSRRNGTPGWLMPPLLFLGLLLAVLCIVWARKRKT